MVMLFNSTRRSLAVVIGIFVLSLLVRFDFFTTTPLGKSYFNPEFQRWTNTEMFIHPLYVFFIYRSTTVSEHQFLSYRGESIYPSFSPGLFIVPYVVSRWLGVLPTSVFLQVFVLSLQFVSTIVLFFLVKAWVKDTSWKANSVAVLSALAFIFNTNTLETFFTSYWAHQLAMPVYLGLLYLFITYRERIPLWSLGSLTFALAYIYWTGFFTNLGLLVYYLSVWKQDRFQLSSLKPAGVIVFASVLALVANVGHFMVKLSLTQYVEELFGRASARSVFVESLYENLPLTFVQTLAWDYGAYGVVLVLLLGWVFIWRWQELNKTIRHNSFVIAVMLITFLPIIESILLMEHDTVYNFGRLKYIVPIVLALSLLAHEVIKKKDKFVFVVWGLFIWAAILHTNYYRRIHSAEFYSLYEGQGIEIFDSNLRTMPEFVNPESLSLQHLPLLDT